MDQFDRAGYRATRLPGCGLAGGQHQHRTQPLAAIERHSASRREANGGASGLTGRQRLLHAQAFGAQVIKDRRVTARNSSRQRSLGRPG